MINPVKSFLTHGPQSRSRHSALPGHHEHAGEHAMNTRSPLFCFSQFFFAILLVKVD